MHLAPENERTPWLFSLRLHARKIQSRIDNNPKTMFCLQQVLLPVVPGRNNRHECAPLSSRGYQGNHGGTEQLIECLS